LGDKSLNKESALPRKLILMGLYLVSFLAIALALPVVESTRNQVIGLFGIVLSGVIAFSSTSIVANIMAGIVLRFTKPFRTGDFIRVNGYFGRVSEKGLFDTEIQTEQRELVAFTNSYLTSNPITVIRSSGTIISANLSIGYDHSHSRIEKSLIEAAGNAGLEEPFVEIIELGNYSISYRVSGLLAEVKSLISSRSRLYANILDNLHGAQIEIMSPNFINSRQINDQPPAIPKPERMKKVEAESNPESIIFDKAEEAEQKELKVMTLSEQIKALQTQFKEADSDKKEKLKLKIERLQLQLKKAEDKPVKE
jgi:small-conductance mechanosensitive channel